MSNYGSFSKIGRKNHYLDILKSKIGRKNHYLEKLNSKNRRKFYYSQKLCFDKFSEWKEYNFLSGFLTNMILNFCQEWRLLSSFQLLKPYILDVHSYIWPQVKIHSYIQHPCQIIIAWARTFRNCTRAMCIRYNAVHQAKSSFINYVDKTRWYWKCQRFFPHNSKIIPSPM